MARHFGAPLGASVNDPFVDRDELRAAGVHAPPQSGISGTELEGADSIVVNGGYVDDEDHGDYIIYTGAGGRDPSTGHQIADQSWDNTNNAGLVTSELKKLPVRVTRGWQAKTPYSPKSGYVYAGLFEVSAHWEKVGADGFKIVQVRLDRIPEQDPFVSNVPIDPDPAYKTTEITRRIRDTALSRSVKNLYSDACQVCGLVTQTFDGRTYSEGAHVRPLGNPHFGSDTKDNLLCLCPNHHVALDMGGIAIDNDGTVRATSDGSIVMKLTFKPGHAIAVENLEYQRSRWINTT